MRGAAKRDTKRGAGWLGGLHLKLFYAVVARGSADWLPTAEASI
jgi:hypothetical protein